MSQNTETQRISFATTKNQFPYPDFLEVQMQSFRDACLFDAHLSDARRERGSRAEI